MVSVAAYTLERLLTEQAVIQRDITTPDSWGADSAPNWQPHLTVACRLWWVKGSSSGRSMNEVIVSANRQTPVSEGGLILPAGVDVTQRDRITQIIAADGSVRTNGIIQIIAVLDQGDHLEIDILRTSLGA